MYQDVVGWIMAWLPKGSTNYNFEFFASGSTNGPNKYDYFPFGDSIENSYFDMSACERASTELQLLKEGKLTKCGMSVVDGYVQPVLGKKNIF
jgi:hypothetical protein